MSFSNNEDSGSEFDESKLDERKYNDSLELIEDSLSEIITNSNDMVFKCHVMALIGSNQTIKSLLQTFQSCMRIDEGTSNDFDHLKTVHNSDKTTEPLEMDQFDLLDTDFDSKNVLCSNEDYFETLNEVEDQAVLNKENDELILGLEENLIEFESDYTNNDFDCLA